MEENQLCSDVVWKLQRGGGMLLIRCRSTWDSGVMAGRFRCPVGSDALCPWHRTVLQKNKVLKSDLLSCSILELMALMPGAC